MPRTTVTPTKNNNRSIGNVIEAFRTIRGWTRARMADELGISPTYYSELAANKYSPSFSLLVRIRRLTGASLDALVPGQEEAKHGH